MAAPVSTEPSPQGLVLVFTVVHLGSLGGGCSCGSFFLLLQGVEVVKELGLEVRSDDLGARFCVLLLGVVDVGLGKVIGSDHLLDISLLKDIHLF